MLRHMKSLRTMRRDNGWIHTLLEEAENERMHLLTFLQLRQPGLLFRGTVLLAQVCPPPSTASCTVRQQCMVLEQNRADLPAAGLPCCFCAACPVATAPLAIEHTL